MTPIEIGLAVAIVAAIGWGLTHRAKATAALAHVGFLHKLIGDAPALATASPAAPPPVAPAAPTIAAAPPPPAVAPAAGTAAPSSGGGTSSLPPLGARPPNLYRPVDTIPAVTRNPASNAPEGFPDTSPGGYPLWYAIGGDGKPVGTARLVYDGNTFGSESEIAAYRVAVAQRNLNLAAYQAPAFVGSIPISGLTLDDWCFVDSRADIAWNSILGGDADVFKAKTVEAYYNGLASFNPSTYTGQLASFAG